MSECNHDCQNCASECKTPENTQENTQVDMKEASNKFSKIGKVIAVVSGKGGVGKSMITSCLAVETAKKGNKCAILDADITGPSIPKIFGITEKAEGSEDGILPKETSLGIKVMSVNCLLDNDTDPLVWRGPMLAGIVKQFWTDVIWGELDYMFIDMPPGTGDVPLTVFQSLPIDGIVIVTSPQELVEMIVEKAMIMANMMNVPIYGIVENFAYFECPDCKERHYIYGKSHLEEIAEKFSIKNTARLPINPLLASLCDAGKIEQNNDTHLQEFCKYFVKADKNERS